jgi:hypothetical protein
MSFRISSFGDLPVSNAAILQVRACPAQRAPASRQAFIRGMPSPWRRGVAISAKRHVHANVRGSPAGVDNYKQFRASLETRVERRYSGGTERVRAVDFLLDKVER